MTRLISAGRSSTLQSFGGRHTSIREAQTNEGSNPFSRLPTRSLPLSHLLPFFGEWALPAIDIEVVDQYRQFKVAESESRAAAIERGRPKQNLHGQILRPLSPRSINRTISFLQWVLSIALEYGYVSHNAAQASRPTSSRSWERWPSAAAERAARRAGKVRARLVHRVAPGEQRPGLQGGVN